MLSGSPKRELETDGTESILFEVGATSVKLPVQPSKTLGCRALRLSACYRAASKVALPWPQGL